MTTRTILTDLWRSTTARQWADAAAGAIALFALLFGLLFAAVPFA